MEQQLRLVLYSNLKRSFAHIVKNGTKADGQENANDIDTELFAASSILLERFLHASIDIYYSFINGIHLFTVERVV